MAKQPDPENGIDKRSFRFACGVIQFVRAKESVRWLRVCATSSLGRQDLCLKLIDEGRQITNILGAIVIRTKRNAP